MPTVDANGCKMHYEVDDYTDPWASDAEAVWLQHGVGRSTKFWYHWVPALARNYRVVRRDMRGHGLSSAPPPDHKWLLNELAEDMLAFMAHHYVGAWGEWPVRIVGGLLLLSADRKSVV